MVTITSSSVLFDDAGKPIDTSNYVPSNGTLYLVKLIDGTLITAENTASLEANWEGNYVYVNTLTSSDKIVLTITSPVGVTTVKKKVLSVTVPSAGTGVPPVSYFSAANGGNPVPEFCVCVMTKTESGTYVYSSVTHGA